MTSVQRFLTLIAFAFWQGGFAFYTAIVVPIGTDVLGSPLAQGMITRRVALWINVAGAGALTVMAVDSWMTKRFRNSRLLIVTVMLLILIAQFGLFRHLDSFIDPSAGIVHERSTFRYLHRVYLWLSTAQWAGAVIWLGLTVVAWRRNDRG